MRKKWLIAGLVVVAVGAQGAAFWLDRAEDDRTPVAVATVAVDTGEVTVSVAATGTVRPATTRSLAFGIDGTVARVAVRPGSVVRAGAVLASADTTAAAAAVRQAQDDLDAAESVLDTAERVAAAAATAPAASSARGAAASEMPAGAVPPEDQAVAALDLEAQATGLDAIFTATERVNRARAALAEAKAALTGATITAPIAGTVMTVAGRVGSRVGKGAAFVTLADTYTLQVDASFPEADAGSLAEGQTATVTLADRVGEEFPADVVQVDPVGAVEGNLVTYGVILSFRTQPPGLLVGQTAAVEVRTSHVADTVRVPATAVRETDRGRGLVRVRTGATQAEREVTVGLRGDLYTQITGGLTSGEVVVRSW
ncbi:efflux RND transporter periplasmic adaptor subunit [Paractinoplanes rishiriensis]|uniref:Macrolide transporter subunit MacA n=1 Tax=Paractinoplanes rishiriensis TaxID=1050105 RepID=A0A919K987_9ACTN|nr:efflux RND transporter periplasmic adaptor subunit [Actinoplanes rishiriensis]GIE98921.1 macrolide transporter subunit MacA [Actinoplanes rishiriensis]